MRERIESKHVTKEIKSQMPVIPVEIIKERGCTFCPYYLGSYEKQPRCMMKNCAWDDEKERFHPVLRELIPFYKEKMEKAEEKFLAMKKIYITLLGIIQNLVDYPLLIIDDLGIERNSEFALEQVYNVIDSRYCKMLPLIVTTNLGLNEMKAADLDTAHQRIYSRILEMCVPIYCGGEDKRKEEGTEKLVQVQNLITG